MAYYCCLAKPMLAENPAIGEVIMRSSILHPPRRLPCDTTTAENCSFYTKGHQNLWQSGLETPFNLTLHVFDHLDQLAGSMKANADFSSMPPSAYSFARKIQLDWQNCLQTETESTAELLKHPEIEAVLYEHHIN